MAKDNAPNLTIGARIDVVAAKLKENLRRSRTSWKKLGISAQEADQKLENFLRSILSQAESFAEREAKTEAQMRKRNTTLGREIDQLYQELGILDDAEKNYSNVQGTDTILEIHEKPLKEFDRLQRMKLAGRQDDVPCDLGQAVPELVCQGHAEAHSDAMKSIPSGFPVSAEMPKVAPPMGMPAWNPQMEEVNLPASLASTPDGGFVRAAPDATGKDAVFKQPVIIPASCIDRSLPIKDKTCENLLEKAAHRWGELMELHAKVQEHRKDPNRFKNRGAKLLAMEKRETELKKEIPILYKQLEKEFLVREKMIGQPVTLHLPSTFLKSFSRKTLHEEYLKTLKLVRAGKGDIPIAPSDLEVSLPIGTRRRSNSLPSSPSKSFHAPLAKTYQY